MNLEDGGGLKKWQFVHAIIDLRQKAIDYRLFPSYTEVLEK